MTLSLLGTTLALKSLFGDIGARGQQRKDNPIAGSRFSGKREVERVVGERAERGCIFAEEKTLQRGCGQVTKTVLEAPLRH